MIAQWENLVEKRGWIIQPEGERKNDMGRPSFGEETWKVSSNKTLESFIFQSSFYTLSYA